MSAAEPPPLGALATGEAVVASVDLVERFWASAMGVSLPSADWLPQDQRELLGRLLRREEEAEHTGRDWRGNWDAPQAAASRLDALDRPLLDEPLAIIRSRLRAEHPEWPWEPLWPEGKPFAVCLTHDVDHVSVYGHQERIRTLRRRFKNGDSPWSLVRSAAGIARGLGTSRWRRPEADPHARYEEWLKAEERFGFRSTFFVFPRRVDPWHPFDCTYSLEDPTVFDRRRMAVGEMAREIVAAGWDVGLHASYHSATDLNAMADQKRQLERALGRAVTTVRQHRLHYDVRVTPRLQAEAGFAADSTQGFNDALGFRAGTSFPYPCWDWKEMRVLPLMQVPLHVQDGVLFEKGDQGDQKDVVERAAERCLALMDRVQAVEGCLTLLWHPIALADPVRWETYRLLLEEAKRRGAWGCSVRQLSEWWSGRAERIEQRAAFVSPTAGSLW